MPRASVLSAAIVLGLSACAAPAPQIDLAAEEAAVRAVSARWLEFEQAKDAAGIASLFTADGVIYREDEDPKVGAAAIQESLAASFARQPDVVSSFITDRVDVAASGDLAVERGTWTATGPAGPVDSGWYLTLHRKEGGEWKVAADMAISTKPAEPAGEAAAAPAPGS